MIHLESGARIRTHDPLYGQPSLITTRLGLTSALFLPQPQPPPIKTLFVDTTSLMYH